MKVVPRRAVRASVMVAIALGSAPVAASAAAPAAPRVNDWGFGQNLLSVRFEDRSTNELGFRVETRVPGGSWRTAKTIVDRRGGQPQATGALLSARLETLATPLEYCFRVAAYNEDGTTYANRQGCTRPGTPADFKVLSKTSTSVTLSWRDRAHNERYIDLLVGYASTHELTPVAHWGTLPDVSTVTTYTVTGLRPNIAYEFGLEASNNVGTSEAPRVVARTPPA